MTDSSGDESAVGEKLKRPRRRVVSSSDEERPENVSQIDESSHITNTADSDCSNVISRNVNEGTKEIARSLPPSTLLTASDIGSDSDENERPTEIINKTSSALKSKLLTSSDVESDQENVGESTPDVASQDNRSSSDDDNKEDTVENNTKKKKITKVKKVDEKLQIRSETQRLERERVMRLPCHRPKKRSIREFLSRHKNQGIKFGSLRSVGENMIPIWNEFDRSTKEVAEFFKSDSDEDNEPGDDNPEVNQDNSLLETSENTEEKSPAPTDKTSENISKEEFKTPAITQELDNGENSSKTTNDDKENNMHMPVELEISAEFNESNDCKTENETEKPKDLCEKTLAHSKTQKWLDDISREKPNPVSKLRLSPTVLAKVPVLKATDNLIDLSDDFIEISEKPQRLRSGVQKFMDRLLNVRKPVPSTATTLTTTQTELDEARRVKGLITETITLAPTEVKPGQSYQKFKEKIRNEIEAKWEEQQKEKEAELKGKEGFEEEVLEDEEECLEDEESDGSSEAESEPEEENDVDMQEKPRKSCQYGDSEAEESEVDGDDAEDGDDENENEGAAEENASAVDGYQSEEIECSALPAYQPGGGMLMGGSTLTQMSQKLPAALFSPVSSPAVDHKKTPRTPRSFTPRAMLTPRTETKELRLTTHAEGPKKNLFGSAEPETFEEDDPFMFVSGAFPDTAPQTEHQPLVTEVSSSLSKTKRIILPEDSDDSRDEHAVPALPDETTETTKPTQRIIEDDEVSPQNAEADLPSAKKRKHRLVYSDDEADPDQGSASEEENEIAEDEDPYEINDETEKDLPAPDEIDYDSEENEVVHAKPSDFFEAEAELSESEWSGDEDERGLDRLEAEAGDADTFDQNEMASQLGRIHARQLMDEDARDVRLIQELLFEDGDLHGEGKQRDRKFRWKNLGGFDLTEGGKAEDGSDCEDDGDSQLAKQRHDKALFFQKLEKEGKLNQIEEEITQGDDHVLQLGRELLHLPKPRNPTLLSKTLASRGSFLAKDKAFLSRVAKVTVANGLGPVHSSNFVFAAKEKETSIEVNITSEGLKRKATTFEKTEKKIKLSINPALLDQLR